MMLINLYKCYVTERNRMDKYGGGAGPYMRDTLSFNILPDLLISNSALFDSVAGKRKFTSKNLIVDTIYRPPNQNLLEFIGSSQPLIGRVARENKQCYIMGSFNLDLLNSDLHSIKNNCVKVLVVLSCAFSTDFETY